MKIKYILLLNTLKKIKHVQFLEMPNSKMKPSLYKDRCPYCFILTLKESFNVFVFVLEFSQHSTLN